MSLKAKFGVLAFSLGVIAACGDTSEGDHSGSGGSSGGGVSLGGGAAQGGSLVHGGASSGGAGQGGSVVRSGAGNGGAVTSGGNASSGGASGSPGGGVSAGGRAGGSPGHAGENSAGAAGVGGETEGGSGGSSAGSSNAGGGESGGSEAGGAGGANSACTLPVAMPPIAGCGIYGTVVPDYRLGEATATLSFDIRLRAGVMVEQRPVPVNQIEVQYYFSQEEDSGWQASVDSFVEHAPERDLSATSEIEIVKFAHTLNTEVGYQTHFIRIRNHSPVSLEQANNAGEPYLEFHVTLTPANLAVPNQTHTNDYSYDAAATSFVSNSRIGVFVCGQLVAGCTPGSFGVGP